MLQATSFAEEKRPLRMGGQFEKNLRGRIIRPGDESYDTARRVWNGMIDRRPALIVRCAGVSDVIQCVNFARDQQLPVAVRGGGHNVAGLAVCDDGLMIDLSGMKGIRIDPIKCIARAEPGLTWGELDHETQAFGLAVTGGIQSTTGIAGFTLGGGFGYLARKHGLTCDNLVSADLVTADGRFLTASSHENADLFWGIRGGGGNFGIVTSFEFQLFPLGPIAGGRLIYPLSQAKEVLQFFREWAAQEPDESFTIATFITAPNAEFIPEHLRGQTVIALLVCYSGPADQGERYFAPLRKFGPPAVDQVQIMPYASMQTLLDAVNPPGLNNYWKAEYLRELPDRAIETLVAYAANKRSPMSKILLPHMGGAISRVGPSETAYAHRQAPFLLNVNAMWSGTEDSDMEWAKQTWSAMMPYSAGGVYVNFLSNESQERVQAAYGPEAYRRLVALKNKYDPTNFFHLNQNIKPA